MSETQSPPLYMCVSIDDDPYLHRGERDSRATPPPGALGVTLCGKHVLDYVTPMWPTPYCVECWDETAWERVKAANARLRERQTQRALDAIEAAHWVTRGMNEGRGLRADRRTTIRITRRHRCGNCPNAAPGAGYASRGGVAGFAGAACAPGVAGQKLEGVMHD